MNYKLNIFASFSSATNGGILDRAIEAEDSKHGDFLRLVMINLYNTWYLFEGGKKGIVIEICVLIFCRIMLKDTLNYQQKQRPTLPLLLTCGMLTFISKLMMMFM
jgi:hypothetical protein